jgi:hypothetical protein
LPVLVRSSRSTATAVVLAAIFAAAPACKKTEPVASAPAAPTADEPQGFGPRLVWLAFRASPELVARALDIRDVASSTWADGLKAAYQGRVFVTPPIAAAGDGSGAPGSSWVLAASTRFPDPGDRNHKDDATPALERLSRALGEVQYFATYEVLDLHAWARFVNGAAVRKLAFIGADGTIVWEAGDLTPEERKLGLLYTRKSLGKEPYPSEANVFALAGAWSVDPSTLQSRHLPPSLGLVGTPP